MSLQTANLDKQYIVQNLGAYGMDAWLESEGVDLSEIPEVTVNATWAGLTTKAWCWYNNSTDEEFQEKYGKLYNWFAVEYINDELESAGSVWRVPSQTDYGDTWDWAIANGFNWDETTTGDKVGKALASDGGEWLLNGTPGNTGNAQSNNNGTGFTNLPGGQRHDPAGAFSLLSQVGYLWALTEIGANAVFYYTQNTRANLVSGSVSKKRGFSARLVRNLYTVDFDSQGGSAVEDIPVGDGDTITEPATPTKQFHAFQGWYTDDTFTTGWDFAEDEVTEDTTLFAKWEEIIIEISGESQSQSATSEGSITLNITISGASESSPATSEGLATLIISVSGTSQSNPATSQGLILPIIGVSGESQSSPANSSGLIFQPQARNIPKSRRFVIRKEIRSFIIY